MKFPGLKVWIFWFALAICTPSPFMISRGLADTPVLPIDVLQETFHQHAKSKLAHAAGLAYAALKSNRNEEARKLAQGLQKEPEFADYGLWIAASADYEDAVAKFQKKRYAAAERLAEHALSLQRQVETANPYSPLLKIVGVEAARSEVLIGDCWVRQKKWRKALEDFERAFQGLQTHSALSQLRSESLANYGKACSSARGELCTPWSQKLVSAFPRASEEAKTVLKYFPKAPVHPANGKATNRTQAYKAPDLDFTAFESAMARYFDGKYGKAIEEFRRFLDEFPRSTYRFRARYWLGQALLKQNENEHARVVFANLQLDAPLTYYGLLASFATGTPVDQGIEATVPSAIPLDPTVQPAEMVRLKRAESLIAEGALDLAAFELRDFRAREGLSSPFLLYLAALNNEAGNYSNSFSILSELIQRGYEGIQSSFTLRLIFPSPYMDIIERYSKQNNLDPILVLSLIKQESSFDKGSYSSSGAVGLMQLMPATAVDVTTEIARADLGEIEHNIRVGTKYLRQLMTRFNGNVVLTLAGYNAGPKAVERWLRDTPKSRGVLEFIESIPYKETREYVGSILRNYYWYARRLGLEQKPLSYFWPE